MTRPSILLTPPKCSPITTSPDRRSTIFLFIFIRTLFSQTPLRARGQVAGNRDTGYDKWEDKEYGSEDIKSIEVVGQGDLTSQIQFYPAR